MNGPITWMGGKTFSAKKIIERMPPHVCYCEPFCGGAQVFYRKDRSKVEVLNDLDGELLNFYRILQSMPGHLVRAIRAMPHSRALYAKLMRAGFPKAQTVRRAARFWYLQRCGFAGRIRGRSFGYSKSRRTWTHPKRVEADLRQASERLAGVTLECLPCGGVLKRYDHPDTLFYLDPPYVGMPYYNHNFEQEDHEALASALRGLRGRFMLSYNDHPLVRDLYGWANIEELDVPYRIRTQAVRRGVEMLISN